MAKGVHNRRSIVSYGIEYILCYWDVPHEVDDTQFVNNKMKSIAIGSRIFNHIKR